MMMMLAVVHLCDVCSCGHRTAARAAAGRVHDEQLRCRLQNNVQTRSHLRHTCTRSHSRHTIYMLFTMRSTDTAAVVPKRQRRRPYSEPATTTKTTNKKDGKSRRSARLIWRYILHIEAQILETECVSCVCLISFRVDDSNDDDLFVSNRCKCQLQNRGNANCPIPEATS